MKAQDGHPVLLRDGDLIVFGTQRHGVPKMCYEGRQSPENLKTAMQLWSFRGFCFPAWATGRIYFRRLRWPHVRGDVLHAHRPTSLRRTRHIHRLSASRSAADRLQAQHRGRPSTTLGHRARQGRSRPWALCPPSVYWQPNKSARALEATAMLRDADLGHDAQAMCRLASSVPASSDFEVNHTCSLLPKLAGCGPAFRGAGFGDAAAHGYRLRCSAGKQWAQSETGSA